MSHTSVEMLSSYLDGELSRGRRLRVERHLEECEDCRHRLEGMHRVVETLEGLGRISPTPCLEQQVLKSVATRAREVSLLDRLEGAAERLHIERWVWLPTFGVVIALASIVYLFVLLGALLEKAGAGRFFTNLALAVLGKYKGGPAKAAVVSSGFTGMVSGSSIANIVTTGPFTIPLMKKIGYPAKKAAAVEVASSTDGRSWALPPLSLQNMSMSLTWT